MKKFEINIERKIELTTENIDDLMVCALEGGINYWCRGVRVKLIPDGIKYEFTSELISKGGVIELFDDVTNEKHDLNISKFMNGVKSVCEKWKFNSTNDLMDGYDSEVSDQIIQYGLFGAIVYS